MKSFVQAACVSLALFAGSSQAAQTADVCEGLEDVAKNSWLVSINEEDAADKKGIMDALKLMSTYGFDIRGSIDFESGNDVVVFLYFDQTGFSADPAQGDQRRRSVIGQLVDIEGITVRCNYISTTQPVVGF